MGNNELFETLQLLSKEKGLNLDDLTQKIQTALIIAVKKEHPKAERIEFDIDFEGGKFGVKLLKDIVEEVEDEDNQITLEAAKSYSKRYKMGDICEIPIDTKGFKWSAAHNAKQVMKQGFKELERIKLEEQWGGLAGEAVSAKVIRVEPRTGNATVSVDGNELHMHRNDQIPGETLREGMMIKVFICPMSQQEKRHSIRISRTHRDLVKRLFEIEVPEIYDGIVEVKSISREPGSRTKIAVISNDPNVDAVGACIGPSRSRISKICDELNGEKIDVILYSEKMEEFIAQALKPADVVEVVITDEENRVCIVRVPDHQLSLAIGNKGQNAKLAARLTGFKIDIKPESGYFSDSEDSIQE